MFDLGIVGVGAWGQKLINAVQGSSDAVRFISAATRTPSKVEEFAAERSIELSDDYGSVLGNPSVQGVVICSPGLQHVEQTMAAIDAGKHVLSIKPMALRRDEAVAIFDAASAKGVFVGMAYERCFLPAVDELRRRVKGGALGKIVHAEGAYCVSRYSGMARDYWKADVEVAPPGALADHMLYPMIELIGPVTELQARGAHLATDLTVPDTATVDFRLAGGASGLLTAIGVTPEYARLQFFGTDGWIEIRGATRFEFKPREGEAEIIDFPPFDTLKCQLERFAAAALGEQAFPLTPDQTIASVAAVEAMGLSAAQGSPVTLSN
jgi:predicted dehydrogenase